MKRLIGIFIFAALVFGLQVFMNCATPLESDDLNPPPPSPPPGEVDTLYIYDTQYVFDTVYSSDSIYVVDTVFVVDSFFTIDTFYVYDTVFNNDTVIIVDTVTEVDTVFSIDSFYVYDTVLVQDTVVVVDTFIIVDSVLVYDTIYSTDTFYIVDTVIVVEPDTVDNFVICTQINPGQKQIYWTVKNLNGQYRFKFTGEANKPNPDKTLRIVIGNQEFSWTLSESSEFTADVAVQESTTILVEPKPPVSHGNHIDLCVDISAL